MKRIICILAMLCPYVCGLAQPIPPEKRALSIGDIMPDVSISLLKNYPQTKLPFSAFQKKLTLIDFWATWCGSCVASFPKMHDLQKRYKDELQVLMVNASMGDDSQKIKAFFERRQLKTGKGFSLPYLLQDTQFFQLFPYKAIPHYVWIDGERRVIAITESEAVTDANIAAVLEGKLPVMAFKNDALLFDDAKDALTADTACGGLLYSSILSAARPEKGKKLFWKSAGDGKVSQLRIFNYSLVELYRAAFNKAFDNSNGRLEVATGLEEQVPIDNASASAARYCYELLLPPMTREEALRFLATDLERLFHITAVQVQRMTPVLILRAGDNIKDLLSKNGVKETDMNRETLKPFMKNVSMQELSDALQIVLKTLVVNETGFTQQIDIRFPADLFSYNRDQLASFLNAKGLLLEQGERLLPVARLQSTPSNLPLPKTNNQ